MRQQRQEGSKRGQLWSWVGVVAATLLAGAVALNLLASMTATAAENGQGEAGGGNGGDGSTGDPGDDVRLHAGSEAPYIHNINLYDATGTVIGPDSNKPYSPIETCGKCHDTDSIRHGWHHNAFDPAFKADGRPGEPYVWTNAQTATQLPITGRDWPEAYDLQALGISAWDFTIRFGGRTPGGGLGSLYQDQGAESDEARWDLTGELQANCMSCHLQNASWDYTAWNDAVSKHNFKWAAAAAAPFARVNGAMTDVPDDYDPMMAGFGSEDPMPKVQYREEWFDGNTLLLGRKLTNEIPNQNCLQCHSKRPVGEEALPRWHRQQDVHMAQGMSCVDCHRNGIDHMTVRGYRHDPALADEAVKTLTCKGCHLGSDESKLGEFAAGGRMAAPRPEHEGIPPLHFHEMSCTSCHSGPTPEMTTQRLQTSIGHELGLSSEHRHHRTLPHMVSPVFLDNEQGKLAPHRAVWPAFWGMKKPAATQDGSAGEARIEPLPPEQVAEALSDTLPEPPHEGIWRSLTRQQIATGLTRLTEETDDLGEGTLVYVAGGKVYAMAGEEDTSEAADGADEAPTGDTAASEPRLMVSRDHDAAEPYTWPLGHNVRPAAQSLGAGGCKDCHASDTPMDFSMTAAATWPEAKGAAPTLARRQMHEMRGESTAMLTAWNLLFQGRSAFKILTGLSTLLLVAVLLGYGGYGVRALSRWGRVKLGR